MEISDEIDVFVFDAFGVLNNGAAPIEGAVECFNTLSAMGKQIFILTNSASSTAENNALKFSKLGFHIPPENIISSRLAARNWISKNKLKHWGVIGREGTDLTEFTGETTLIGDDPEIYDAVDGFLLLATSQWNEHKQQFLDISLAANPRPVVVANPDVIAPLEDRFSTNPGFIGHRILARQNQNVDFFGKPFPAVFELIEARLSRSQPNSRIAMVGDTLHTDILGGATRGWSTVLVEKHGVYRGYDVEPFIAKSGIVPTYRVPSI